MRAFAELLLIPNILFASTWILGQIINFWNGGSVLSFATGLIVDIVMFTSIVQIFLFIKGKNKHIYISFFSNLILLGIVCLIWGANYLLDRDNALISSKYYQLWGLYLLPNLLFFYKARARSISDASKQAVTIFK